MSDAESAELCDETAMAKHGFDANNWGISFPTYKPSDDPFMASACLWRGAGISWTAALSAFDAVKESGMFESGEKQTDR